MKYDDIERELRAVPLLGNEGYLAYVSPDYPALAARVREWLDDRLDSVRRELAVSQTSYRQLDEAFTALQAQLDARDGAIKLLIGIRDGRYIALRESWWGDQYVDAALEKIERLKGVLEAAIAFVKAQEELEAVRPDFDAMHLRLVKDKYTLLRAALASSLAAPIVNADVRSAIGRTPSHDAAPKEA